MAVNLLSFPFRLGLDGSPVTQEQSSDECFGEQIAQLISTIPGERIQAPLYGCNDPAFVGIDSTELVYKIELFGPPVQITGVTSQFIDGSTEDVIVEFTDLEESTTNTNVTN